MWGDEFFYCPHKPQLGQLMEVYEKYGDPVITTCKVSDEDTKKYGIIDALEVEDSVYQVKKIVEKPGPEKAPSNLASLGGFILTPDIFEELENTKLGKDGELWLADANAKLLKKRPIYARLIDGEYYDTGSKFGYIKANVDFALRDNKLGPQLKEYLKKIL
jgi:UTP--glucose-1-phosphate uridylyltransferase